ncbi:tripartite tricarboxylate transporter TctB family protein [Lentibacter algarum]|uniref:tripartite tricarboxylate transporter TctB family protein n=1 Tax=Lentibacter algarum TaxID=576131 RepID=UPI001C072267|nr:tripartite tricarboxylate transporter TctB family protein [Lentibacter algarum]MBU2980752.1 tripartite tricarboxylate transporter TctB family protein [Lentibacter algarum]
MANDRLTGAFFVLFGVILWFWIIPTQVDAVDYGWVKPRTVPLALAALLAFCGAALIFAPSSEILPETHNNHKNHWLRAALFAGLLVVGLALMKAFGFMLTAPPLAFALMWLAHERRPLWLLLGAVAVPAFIWLTVAQLLERPLP